VPHKDPKRFLIAEDEDVVRRVASKALRKAGYKVLETRNGQECLDLVKSGKEPIHLLLTDVVMPGMNGRELSRQVLSIQQSMAVLYSSRNGFLLTPSAKRCGTS